MTDLLLIHAPKLDNRYPALGRFMSLTQLPAGLTALAARAGEAGASTAIAHLGLERIADPRFSLGALVRDLRPRAIGVALHFHPQAHDAIKALGAVRAAAPDALVFLGGYTASLFAREILAAHPQADAVVRGDAEAAVGEIARRLPRRGEDLSGIPNLAWTRGAGIVDNGISFVAGPDDLGRAGRARLDLVRHGDLYARIAPWLWYYRLDRSVAWNLRVMGHLTGHPLPLVRGCPFACVYCGGGRDAQAAIVGRRRLDAVPIDRAAADVAALVAQGVTAIFTEYVPLGDGDAYWLGLLHALEGTSAALNVECRAIPSPAFVEAFAKTFNRRRGSRLNLSPDTARGGLRERLKPGIPMADKALTDALDLMERLNVRSELFYTVGLPGEAPDDVAALRDGITSLRRRYSQIEAIRVHAVELDPGSPMHRDPAAYGLVEPLTTFEDYRRHHAGGGSMLEDLGYGVGAARAAHEARVRETVCAQFCRLSLQRSWRAPGRGREAIDAAARAACRARARLDAALTRAEPADPFPY